MPHASRHLGLYLLSADPDAAPDRADALLASYRAGGWIVGDAPGPRALVGGGFTRVRVERSAVPRFLSNWQGGFRVTCPVDGASLVAAFPRALEQWRAGGTRALACACGQTHDLAALRYAPPAAFGCAWLALSGVGEAVVDPEAWRLAERELGGAVAVWRRG